METITIGQIIHRDEYHKLIVGTFPEDAQVCMDGTPTIRIVHREITMADMFNNPAMVRGLKEYELVLNEVREQYHNREMSGRRPSVLIVNGDTYRAINCSGDRENYKPQTRASESDTFMGLEIAIVTSNIENLYVKVM